jgi:hypothetical protein
MDGQWVTYEEKKKELKIGDMEDLGAYGRVLFNCT